MMDFLDPKKSREYTVKLLLGYVLIAIAIVLATTVLLYLASGFNVKQGKVIQNGLVFISSNPSGASIHLNGKLQDAQSNARLVLQSGTYTMRLTREGYRDWQRAVTVEGGSVDHFVYPLLIPRELQATTVHTYQKLPSLVTQSPDRRWLLAQIPGSAGSAGVSGAGNGVSGAGSGVKFDVYDLGDPDPAIVTDRKTTITLPAAVLGLPQAGEQTFQLAEWARNNTHVLLKHIVGGQFEYILLSRDKPEESINLTRHLRLGQNTAQNITHNDIEITLQDKKYDRYFIHDKTAQTLSAATLDAPTPRPLLTGVIQYKTYGNDVVLYATGDGATAGNVAIKLYQGERSYLIRQVAAQGPEGLGLQGSYLLDVSTYDSDWYIVLGTSVEDHVFVYRNPVERLKQDVSQPLVPIEILKLKAPNYAEFSANSQFIMAENGQHIAVFDAENERSYTYKLDRPIDTPQTHVTWLDGYHLRFVSNGMATIFDYDGTNAQTLTAGDARFLPFFDTTYRTLYAIASAGASGGANPAPNGNWAFTTTPLRTERDR